MTLQIRNRLIAGVPATKVRDALRLAAQVEPFTHYLIAKECKLSARRARQLLNELVRTEYLAITHDPSNEEPGPWYLVSAKGMKLANASAMSRLSRTKGDRLLADFMKRVQEVNASSEYLVTVSVVVVYGSYVRGEKSLGDVDIAFELDRKPHYKHVDQKGFLELTQQRVAAARVKGRTFSSFLDRLLWPSQEVMLYLKARTRGLSLHPIQDFYNMSKDKNFSYEILLGDRKMVEDCLREASPHSRKKRIEKSLMQMPRQIPRS